MRKQPCNSFSSCSGSCPEPRKFLRFTPTAWAKLQFFCQEGKNEIGGFGITNKKDNLLIEEFVTVKQQVTPTSIAFDDEAVADFFDAQVTSGRKPEEFARIWCHTHPGNSPIPSNVDEETFQRVFGKCVWAVMFILAREGNTYARLKFNVGPGGAVPLGVRIDYKMEFPGSSHQAWDQEYRSNIHPEPAALPGVPLDAFDDDWELFGNFGKEFHADVRGKECRGFKRRWFKWKERKGGKRE